MTENSYETEWSKKRKKKKRHFLLDGTEKSEGRTFFRFVSMSHPARTHPASLGCFFLWLGLLLRPTFSMHSSNANLNCSLESQMKYYDCVLLAAIMLCSHQWLPLIFLSHFEPREYLNIISTRITKKKKWLFRKKVAWYYQKYEKEISAIHIYINITQQMSTSPASLTLIKFFH